jgi:hypothetical protein
MSGCNAGKRDYMRSFTSGSATSGPSRRPRSAEPVILQFPAQRGAMDPEHRGSAALIAVAVLQHFGEQWNLEFAQRDFIQIGGAGAVQVADIATYGIRNVIAQRRTRGRAGGGFVAIGPIRGRIPLSGRRGGVSLACVVVHCHGESRKIRCSKACFPMNGNAACVMAIHCEWPGRTCVAFAFTSAARPRCLFSGN